MSWSGRKRDATADRYPSGKIRRPKPAAVPVQPHRKGYGSNPLAETVHGRYYLGGQISHAQMLAGAFYARARLRYRAAIGSPDSLRSRSEGHPAGNGDNDAQYIADYEKLREVLGHLLVDVDWVITQDAMLSDLIAYRAGLDVLRKFYRV